MAMVGWRRSEEVAPRGAKRFGWGKQAVAALVLAAAIGGQVAVPVPALAAGSGQTQTVSTQAAQGTITNADEFFRYMASKGESGANNAAKVLHDGLSGKWTIGNTGTSFDGHGYADYTHVGSATDATSLKNMYTALDIIDACNALRRAEGVPELKVSDSAMAIAMVNANFSSAYWNTNHKLVHAAMVNKGGQQYYWGENIALGRPTVAGSFGDWYWQEKADYTGTTQKDGQGNTYKPTAGKKGNETNAGHYLNIIDPSYIVTGAGYNPNGPIYSQEFKYANTLALPSNKELDPGDKLYTAAEYRARLQSAVKGSGGSTNTGNTNSGSGSTAAKPNTGNTNANTSKPSTSTPAKAQWIKSGSRWWYRHADGSYTKNGWEKIGGKWYLFDGSGWMRTGWAKVGGIWYYLNPAGDMATGWKKVGSTWYYLEGSGAMATGWKKLSGKWYYLAGSGAMRTGWYKVGAKWYWSDGSGAMAANRWIGNYYVTGSGAMATNTWIGRYWVDGSGKWTATR